MCGIAGIVDFAGRGIEPGVLESACDSMRHRGPDDAGTWLEGRRSKVEGQRSEPSAGFAATRLAVLDPTPAGHQPMTRDGGRFVIVFNGLIYNYRELREALARGFEKGFSHQPLTTRCDTEVALAACAQWGPEALNRFNGMWALAFYDRRKGTGFLARDRFGIKPLVWVEHERRLLFASEIRTLKRLGHWPDHVNQAALVQYVRYGYVIHPQTIYEAVHRLPPATYVRFGPESVGTPVRYYEPSMPDHGRLGCEKGFSHQRHSTFDIRHSTFVEAAHRVRRAVFESVARRRVADVPIGAFLSGGMDSSIVVAHLAELSSEPIQTFSIGWTDEQAYDETAYARMVAQRFGTRHHELKCRFDDVIDLLPSMLDHLGEPFFDSSILPTAIVSEFARRHVTVALSGDGADELFGGYWRYQAHGFYERYQRIPRWIRRRMVEPLIRSMASSKSSMMGDRVRQFRKMLRADVANPALALGARINDDALYRHMAWSQILAPEAREVLKQQEEADSEWRMAKSPISNRHSTFGSPADPLNRILLFDLQNSLPCDMLHKVDLASMNHSLEVRVPFLDPEVVAVAVSLPSSMKTGRGGNKIILKEAYRDLLPEAVLDRPKKGFEVPIGEFLRHELREMFLDTVTKPLIESFELLDYHAVQRVYADHCARRGEHADLLFALLSLCWWRRGERWPR
ncbi:MAG: asparagine synthase (glutamine-hydrolyzing) [Phycisphaerae bacterium]